MKRESVWKYKFLTGRIAKAKLKAEVSSSFVMGLVTFSGHVQSGWQSALSAAAAADVLIRKHWYPSRRRATCTVLNVPVIMPPRFQRV